MHVYVLILISAASHAPNQRATTATSPKSCKSERDSLQRATSSSTVLSTTTRSTSGTQCNYLHLLMPAGAAT
ncbi:hypothetical protein PR001_g9592 [Phytophthora rubi]|uniref:Uncharacterized protein n=1 Tax=Phytophthora rubi TaxID=129364 RepID=A0A6A3N3B2_9STRA|nr:hypothetical protein PR001_g9592 [Phytophthora rubi]